MAYVVDQSYRDWQRAYGDVDDALPAQAAVACPHCGHRTLRLEFVGDPDDRIGYAEFWCDNCHFGIHVSRTAVPDGVQMHLIETPVDDLMGERPS
jgi:hypothetical protein